MEAQMKARKGWKDSRCCDWSWFDTHRLGEERTWNAAAPQVLVCCVELGQMTSFWQDYPKPGFNLYVRIIHFYNMTMTKDSKKDSLIPGFHASISLGFGLIVKDKLSHLKAIHMISLRVSPRDVNITDGIRTTSTAFENCPLKWGFFFLRFPSNLRSFGGKSFEVKNTKKKKGGKVTLLSIGIQTRHTTIEVQLWWP